MNMRSPERGRARSVADRYRRARRNRLRQAAEERVALIDAEPDLDPRVALVAQADADRHPLHASVADARDPRAPVVRRHRGSGHDQAMAARRGNAPFSEEAGDELA